jgi:hypothetical protein
MTKDGAQPTPERPEWTIQRCTQGWIGTELQYEDWPGYSEFLMSRTQMLDALKECQQQWPEHEFRGHNVVNQLERNPIRRHR